MVLVVIPNKQAEPGVATQTRALSQRRGLQRVSESPCVVFYVVRVAILVSWSCGSMAIE